MTIKLEDLHAIRDHLQAGKYWLELASVTPGVIMPDIPAANTAALIAMAHFQAIEAIKSVAAFDAFPPYRPKI